PLAKITVERAELQRASPSKRRDSAARTRRDVSVTETSASDLARHFGADAVGVEARIDNVVDLRGVRAEEALTLVEVGRDRAMGAHVDLVILKHGHGAGAPRRVVREHLPRLAHVHRFRRGLPVEGGDAVTVVWVR